MYIKHLLVKKYMDVQRLMYCYVRSIEAICNTRTNFQTKNRVGKMWADV